MATTSDNLEIGVVGLGGMGTNHASNAVDLGAVVAGADVMAPARESFAAEFDAPTYENHEALYDEADPDGVVITTPNAFHAPAAVAALERDIPVLVEKPLANTMENARDIEAAANGSDAFCMVGFHNRFCGAADLYKEFDAQGRFGEIQHVEANYLRRRGIPGIGSWFTTKELSGGGALIDIGVHALDFALYLAGFPEVESVNGTTRSDFGTRSDYADPDGWSGHWDSDDDIFDVDDSATAFIRCKNGTTITLDISWATNREATNGTVVRGTEAGASLQLCDDTLRVFESGTTAGDHHADAEYTVSRDKIGHEAGDELFLQAISAGEAPETNTLEEGLAVQRVLDAIYRSSETGELVSLS
ncbi:Gfo/Idh/MocA family protein [Haloarcula marina]|uniref:Gfo/Idh/MocA family protein n=1 Tax=Haloarcula marina TaxID=2961574 RepID=UPI0024E0F988|nr:Gfo/Idh/MocA family oxidoreductase [Halomicroarcula marina]